MTNYFRKVRTVELQKIDISDIGIVKVSLYSFLENSRIFGSFQ